MKPEEKLQFLIAKASERSKQLNPDEMVEIFYGSATCENAAGATGVEKIFRKLIAESKRTNFLLKRRGCTGSCSKEPVVTIQQQGKAPVHYHNVDDSLCREIFNSHVLSGQPVGRNTLNLFGDNADLQNQNRVALRNCGKVDPESLDDFLLHNGFRALAGVLEKGDPNWPIEEVTRSHLRGRGGAGYPSGLKWKSVAQSKESVRYLICNADEGDPGAFMDRDMLESDPFSIIEGMLIVAYSIGARQGYFYIRSEYPLAIKRVENALALCRENGILGKSILESEFACDIEIRPGAGAFVCGEETALIASIEGKRGWPRIRPPYPAEVGLWGKPTIINNVETFANVPAIIEHGAEWFSKIGTTKSGGTKVFALSGKVENTGLVEVPMGTTLRKIVYEFGGGVPDSKALKAVQTGGPAGGCIPAEKLDTPIDYDTLMSVGSIMGSGGMIVMDETKCMVDTAKFFMAFSQDESCGECTPCREGTKRILEILERITSGMGVPEDIGKLERLCHLIRKSSLCGLGRAAPNPVLSTLRYFRNEYESHINDKHCQAGQCTLK
jgi:NADH:ubiquinone oxidoreductase subunit F (NADH-binding)/(2Fe-2S) ferredoxin